jgi:hypothetical protein
MFIDRIPSTAVPLRRRAPCAQLTLTLSLHFRTLLGDDLKPIRAQFGQVQSFCEHFAQVGGGSSQSCRAAKASRSKPIPAPVRKNLMTSPMPSTLLNAARRAATYPLVGLYLLPDYPGSILI